MGSEQPSARWNERQALLLWWVACAMCAVIVRLLSTGILEGGDGVQHYQIARYSWQHPILLLHHWGKPLFTLLSSPFAQLGHWGMTLFNACCYIAACWLADGLLIRAGRLARWMFAPMLMLVPVYGTMVLGGMTEVLFGTLAAGVILLFAQGRFNAALALASFMPFSRPEYVAFVPFALLWTMLHRRWRDLPWVLLGHSLYALIGAVVFRDPLWAFHHDPYTGAADIYGHGEPLHFIKESPEAFGAPFLWLLIPSWLALAWLLLRKGGRGQAALLLFMAVLPSFAVLVLHSFLWWKGLKGSLGLTRVLATTAPMLVLTVCWSIGSSLSGLGRFSRIAWPAGIMAVFIYIHFAADAFLAIRPLPVAAEAYDRFIIQAGKRAGGLVSATQRLVYFHPSIAYAADRDPYDIEQSSMGLAPILVSGGLRDGDLIAWDSHFGPNEGGTSLESLLKDPGLELVAVLAPEERMVVLGGRAFEVYLFRRMSGSSRMEDRMSLWPEAVGHGPKTTSRADTLRCAVPNGICLAGSEFPFSLEGLPLDTASLLLSEVRVTGRLSGSSDDVGELNLVFSEEDDNGKLSYWSERLLPGAVDVRFTVPPRTCGVRNKLYLWHLQPNPIRFDSLRIEAVRLLRIE